MLRPKHRSGAKARAPRPADSNPLNAYAQSFLEWSAVHGRSAQTIETRARALRRFIGWCDERDLSHPKDVTLPILERYQRYLYHYRKPNGAPLTFGSQQTLLAPLKAFFQWAARERHLLYNPASELLLPRLPRRLPQHILSIPDITQENYAQHRYRGAVRLRPHNLRYVQVPARQRAQSVGAR